MATRSFQCFVKPSHVFSASGQKVEWGMGGGNLFARERQTASACPSGQNAETKFSSSLFDFFGGARNLKIGEENFIEA